MLPELMGSELMGSAGLAHWGALVPSAVAACCSIGARRSRSVTNAVLGFVMLVAMLDMASGAGIVWPVAWCALLVALAVIPVMQARGSASRSAMTMAAHRSIGMIAMAAMIGRMPGESTSTAPDVAHHASAGLPMLTIGIALYLLVSAALVGRLLRGPNDHSVDGVQKGGTPRRHILEFASMSSAIALMAIAG